MMSQERAQDLNEMDKCGYADKYKANHRPTCWCIACREKYIDALEAKLHAQRKETFDMRIALEFYSFAKNYESIEHWMLSPIEEDHGRIARDALVGAGQ